MGKLLLLRPAIPNLKFWGKITFLGVFYGISLKLLTVAVAQNVGIFLGHLPGNLFPESTIPPSLFGMSNPIVQKAEGKVIQPRDLAALHLQNSQKQTEQKYFCSTNIKPTR